MKRECFEQIFISKKNISHEIENYSLSKDPKFSRSKIFKRKPILLRKLFSSRTERAIKQLLKKLQNLFDSLHDNKTRTYTKILSFQTKNQFLDSPNRLHYTIYLPLENRFFQFSAK